MRRSQIWRDPRKEFDGLTDAVMVGRPYLYGLGAGGKRGVEWVLDHLVSGMKRTMALCGRSTVRDLTRDLVTL